MTFILDEDESLQSYLKGMTVSDNNRAPRDVDVWFGLPDFEAKTRVFPYLMIFLVDVVPAHYRKHEGFYEDLVAIPGEEIPTGHQKFVRKLPEPFDLIYQVTSIARNPRHDRMIMNQMLHKFPGNYGVFPIVGQENDGNYRPAFLDEFGKADHMAQDGGESKREFRNVFTIRVPSELDPDIATAAKTVDTVRINVAPVRFVPSALDRP
jgi:hypothetical protein